MTFITWFDVLIFRICVYARYNIQYGRIGASDREVEEAASSADMHSRILTFPKGKRTTAEREKEESFSDDHGYGSVYQPANKMTFLGTNIRGQRRP